MVKQALDFSTLRLLLTCEHAGNQIPQKYQFLFKNNKTILQTHKGYDPGALDIAKAIAKRMSSPLLTYTYSRLLIDPNRSLHHPNCFSDFTKMLSQTEKEKIITKFYQPHRCDVFENVESIIKQRYTVLHIGVHTFTPKLNGNTRNADIGILYDPKRSCEKAFALAWQAVLKQMNPNIRVRRNYPYLGSADGLTTSLRKQFKQLNYLGIELEVNHKHFFENQFEWSRLVQVCMVSLPLVLSAGH